MSTLARVRAQPETPQETQSTQTWSSLPPGVAAGGRGRRRLCQLFAGAVAQRLGRVRLSSRLRRPRARVGTDSWGRCGRGWRARAAHTLGERRACTAGGPTGPSRHRLARHGTRNTGGRGHLRPATRPYSLATRQRQPTTQAAVATSPQPTGHPATPSTLSQTVRPWATVQIRWVTMTTVTTKQGRQPPPSPSP